MNLYPEHYQTFLRKRHELLYLQSHIMAHLIAMAHEPKFKTIDAYGDDIVFGFTESLLKIFANQPEDIIEPYNVILRNGFRHSYSPNGLGVFFQEEDGDPLEKTTNEYIREYDWIVNNFLGLRNVYNAKPIKLMIPNQNGHVMVGALSHHKDQLKRVLFLGYAPAVD